MGAHGIHSNATLNKNTEQLSYWLCTNFLARLGAIRLEAAADHIAIRNPAGDLGPDDLGSLFDRFWRKDTARTGYGHSGLGLSLVRGFCDLLGWSIRASLEPSPGPGPEAASAAELEIRIDFEQRISDA